MSTIIDTLSALAKVANEMGAGKVIKRVVTGPEEDPNALHCFRLSSISHPLFPSLEELYKNTVTGQDEWWDPPSTFADDLHEDPLLVAVRGGEVVAFLQYGYYEDLKIARILVAAALKDAQKAKDAFLCVIRPVVQALEQWPDCQCVVYEVISPAYYRAKGDQRGAKEAELRADHFKMCLKRLIRGTPLPMRLDFTFMQPKHPERGGEPVPMWVFYIPIQGNPTHVPIETQIRIANLLHDEYLLEQDVLCDGGSYNQHVNELRSRTLAILQMSDAQST